MSIKVHFFFRLPVRDNRKVSILKNDIVSWGMENGYDILDAELLALDS